MTEELRRDLERFGRVEGDTVNWVPVGQWYSYWHCYVGTWERDAIIKEFSEKYPDYSFGIGECHINNVIYPVINIYKRK